MKNATYMAVVHWFRPPLMTVVSFWLTRLYTVHIHYKEPVENHMKAMEVL